MSKRNPIVTPARIAPLAKLPVFLSLSGRRAMVVGDSDGARWKAELLSAAGARVEVYAGAAPDDARWAELVAQPVDGVVELIDRDWSADDFSGDVAVAIGDFPIGGEAVAFATAARRHGVPVNVVDQPMLCDFQIGSIVNRSPVVIGISTDGAAPMLGQSIRSKLEAVLPAGLAHWAAAARNWRADLKNALPDAKARRRFWTRFVDAAWLHPEHRPTEGDFDRLKRDDAATKVGQVMLVGAGPGDPELLTMKAVRALQQASVIMYDDLVAPEILELARREARRISVGKRGRGPSVSQSDIDRQLVQLALAGERVVRLKGGDPLIFGRATEELNACREAGVPIEIVPGITAAQGAAASIGMSLTERQTARRLQFVTGHGMSGKLPDDLDWAAIADPMVTTALYMGRGTIAEFCQKAISAGLDPLTPALAVASATLPEQAEIQAPLATLPQMIAKLPTGAPVVVLIGKAMRQEADALCAAA